uniref:IPT/TIG domain-containing protein n=1 Tax=Wenjunlia vitaminophila TaxID=76728 RepID=UPI000361F397
MTITGTNLTGAVVKFGTRLGTVVTNTGTVITVTPPPGNGAVPVTVTTPGGSVSAGQYFYIGQPFKAALSADTGPAAGGNTITITGTGLATTSGVSFGTTPGTGIVATNDGSVDVVVPAGTGTVPVTVTTKGGTTNGLFYNYAPTLSTDSISPASGPQSGGTPVSIGATTGGLSTTESVSFGANPAAFGVVSDNLIVAYSPPGTGAVTVNIVTAGGPDTTPQTFTYTPPPA